MLLFRQMPSETFLFTPLKIMHVKNVLAQLNNCSVPDLYAGLMNVMSVGILTPPSDQLMLTSFTFILNTVISILT